MLYILAVLAGIAVGVIFGGKLSNILNLKIEKPWIIIMAFVVQTVPRILSYKGYSSIARYSMLIQGIVVVLLVLGFWYNRRYIGMLIVGAGFVFNSVVMLANGGKMPVGYEALQSANMLGMIEGLKTGLNSKHVIVSQSTRLVFLADIIYIPSFLGIGMRVVSIGDLIIAAGIFVLAFGVVYGRIYKPFGRRVN